MSRALTAVVLCLAAAAAAVGQGNGQPQQGKRRVDFVAQADAAADRKPIQMKSKKAGRAEFSSGLNYCELADVKLKDGKKYSKLQVPGIQVVPEPGMPETPRREELIRIPAGAKVSLVVDSVTWQEVDGEVELPPVQPPRPDIANADGSWRDDSVPFTKNAAAYSIDAFPEDAPVALGEKVRVRGREYVKVIYRPVSYNPVQKKLRVAHNVQWHLNVEAPKEIKRRRPDRFWNHPADAFDVRTPEVIEAEEPK